MNTRTYKIKLTGQSPLLLHNDHLAWTEKIKTWRSDPANKGASVPGDDRSPAWTWIGSLYVDGGALVIPSDNLMTVLREGAKRCPTGKGKGTFKAQSQSGLIVDDSAWCLTINDERVPYAPIEALKENPDFEEHQRVVASLGFALFQLDAQKKSDAELEARLQQIQAAQQVQEAQQRRQLQAMEQAVGTARLMKLFHAIGSQFAESEFVSSDMPAAGALSPAQAKNKIAGMFADEEFMARYMNQDARVRQGAIEEMTRLHQMANPELLQE